LLAVPATVIIWAIVEELWPSPTVRERRRIRWLPNLEPKNPSEPAPPATPPATTAHR
jgi:hypothetical protein